MSVGIITGSGTYALPGFGDPEPVPVRTPFGEAPVTRGSYAGVEALHVSRHGAGHVRLSNHVTHRANVWALKELGKMQGPMYAIRLAFNLKRLEASQNGRPPKGYRPGVR